MKLNHLNMISTVKENIDFCCDFKKIDLFANNDVVSLCNKNITWNCIELHDSSQDTKHYWHRGVSDKPASGHLTNYWDFGGKVFVTK